MMSTPGLVLLTGFAPFGGESINPSAEIARALDGSVIAGHRVVGAVLPTEFGRALPTLESLLERHRPSLVLASGQAGGRAQISLERVAINWIDAHDVDNAGMRPVDVPVVAGGPNAYFSTLPLNTMLARLGAAGLPAAISYSAGTFVCNQVFFGLLHRLAAWAERDAPEQTPRRGGFVHLPYLPEQVARHPGAPSLPREAEIAAVRICLEVALTTPVDGPRHPAATPQPAVSP